MKTMYKCTLCIYVPIINAVLWKLLPSSRRCPLKGQVVYWNGKINFIYLLSHNWCEMAQSLADLSPSSSSPVPISGITIDQSIYCPKIADGQRTHRYNAKYLSLAFGGLLFLHFTLFLSLWTREAADVAVSKGEDLSITATDLIRFSTGLAFIIWRIWAQTARHIHSPWIFG